MPDLVVITFDLSRKRTGYAVGQGEIEDSGSFSCKKLGEAYTQFMLLLNLWRPSQVWYAKPTRYYHAIRAQAKVEGVLELAVENYNVINDKKIKLMGDLVDSSCKKAILGSGKATKEDIKKHYGKESEDEADAMMFFDYAIKMLQEL